MNKLISVTALMAALAAPALAQAPDTSAPVSPDFATEPLESDTAAISDGAARDGYAPVSGEIADDALIDATVYSADDEKVGTVSGLTPDGVVVDAGGFLGIGTHPVAIPKADLEMFREDGGETIRAFTTKTRDQIEALPEYAAP